MVSCTARQMMTTMIQIQILIQTISYTICFLMKMMTTGRESMTSKCEKGDVLATAITFPCHCFRKIRDISLVFFGSFFNINRYLFVGKPNESSETTAIQFGVWSCSS